MSVATRPDGQRPRTALSRPETAVGRVVAAPLTAHDVVTPERLLGGDLLAGQPADRVAISVPVLDAGSVGVRPGNHVDLYATARGHGLPPTSSSWPFVMPRSRPDSVPGRRRGDPRARSRSGRRGRARAQRAPGRSEPRRCDPARVRVRAVGSERPECSSHASLWSRRRRQVARSAGTGRTPGTVDTPARTPRHRHEPRPGAQKGTLMIKGFKDFLMRATSSTSRSPSSSDRIRPGRHRVRRRHHGCHRQARRHSRLLQLEARRRQARRVRHGAHQLRHRRRGGLLHGRRADDHLAERRKAGVEPARGPSEEVILLTEIRDSLRAR